MNVTQTALSDAAATCPAPLYNSNARSLSVDRPLVLAIDHRDPAQPGQRLGALPGLEHALQTRPRPLPASRGDRLLALAEQIVSRPGLHRRRCSHSRHRTATGSDTRGRRGRTSAAQVRRASHENPRTASTIPAAAHSPEHDAAPPTWLAPARVPSTHAPDRPSMRCVSGSDLGDVAQRARRVLGVVEDAGDEDHRQEDGVDVGGRRVEVGDHVRERDAERREAHDAEHEEDDQRRPSPAARRPRRRAGRRPARSRPARTVLVTRVAGDRGEVRRRAQRRAAHALEDPPLAQRDHVVGQRHASSPTSRSCRRCPARSRRAASWSPVKIAPKSASRSSGSRKLKNAALGLRQNIRRSSRYCAQASASPAAAGTASAPDRRSPSSRRVERRARSPVARVSAGQAAASASASAVSSR